MVKAAPPTLLSSKPVNSTVRGDAAPNTEQKGRGRAGCIRLRSTDSNEVEVAPIIVTVYAQLLDHSTVI